MDIICHLDFEGLPKQERVKKYNLYFPFTDDRTRQRNGVPRWTPSTELPNAVNPASLSTFKRRFHCLFQHSEKRTQHKALNKPLKTSLSPWPKETRVCWRERERDRIKVEQTYLWLEKESLILMWGLKANKNPEISTFELLITHVEFWELGLVLISLNCYFSRFCMFWIFHPLISSVFYFSCISSWILCDLSWVLICRMWICLDFECDSKWFRSGSERRLKK